MVNGNSKGANFENDICRLISRWVVPTTPLDAKMENLPFRRRFTASVSLEGHWASHGDVLCKPGIEFPFSVECKKIEQWELDSLLQLSDGPIWKWWRQAVEQADRAGNWPLLIFARNRIEPYVLLDESVSLCLRLLPLTAPVLHFNRPRDPRALALARLDDLLATDARKLRNLATKTKSR